MSELLERDALLDRLESLRSEGGRLVFVGGEAGVGKTVARPRLRGGHRRPDPARVLREPDHADAARARCSTSGSRSTATRVASRRPCSGSSTGRSVLVLEDVHWADQATLDVLRVLGRRIDTTRALALVTYRDDEVDRDHPLRIVLGELASAAGVTRLSVPRLSLDAVRALAEPLGADADAIHRLTHGNAFYVTEILAARTRRCPRRCATRCSRGRRSSSRRRDGCSMSSRSCRARRAPAARGRGARRARAAGRVPRVRRAPRRRRRCRVQARACAARRRERARAAPAAGAQRSDRARSRRQRRRLAARPPRRGSRGLRRRARVRAGRRGASSGRAAHTARPRPSTPVRCGTPAPWRQRSERGPRRRTGRKPR